MATQEVELPPRSETAPRDEPALDARVTVIAPTSPWRLVDLREMWRYREVLYFLMWRDIKVRYKQTLIGAAWALLQPVLPMLAFTLFLGSVAKAKASPIPYPLFVFSGLVPWTFFAAGLAAISVSILANERLVTKVYFPRLLVPLSALATAGLDFFVATTMLCLLVPMFGMAPTWGLLWIPAVAASLLMLLVGLGSFLAALYVRFRDVRMIIGPMIQFWMFATPSVFMQNPDAIGPRMEAFLVLNPVHAQIATFRAALLGDTVDVSKLLTSTCLCLAAFVLGTFFFRSAERRFADVI